MCSTPASPAILDTFEAADELAGERRFDVTVASPRPGARTHHGFSIPAAPLATRAPDLVVVPALACKQPDESSPALDRADVHELAAAVTRYAQRARIAAACTGTFVFGRAGVLDGKRATTSWWLGPTFRRTFPAVELDEAEMIVADDGVLTAGAALAHLDLALAVIRERSPNLASLVARYLLFDDRPSQAPFVAPSHVAYDDELVKRFDRWVRRHLREPFELGPRSARRGRERTHAPAPRARRARQAADRVRAGPAARTRRSHVARDPGLDRRDRRRVGYEDGSTLRNLLRRKLHRVFATCDNCGRS